MWLPGRAWLGRFRPPTVTPSALAAFAPAAVGPDRVERAVVGGNRVESVAPAEVGTLLDPGFVPVAVRAVSAELLDRVFGALADRAAAAREADDPPLRPTPVFRGGPLPDPPRRRRPRPATAPEPNWDSTRSGEIRRVPRMSAAETRAVLEELAAFGPVVRVGRVLCRVVAPAERDRYDALRNRLVVAHLRLVLYQIDRDRLLPRSGTLRWADLVQEGVFGLMRAAELFDPAVGVRFATYALHWVRQALNRAVTLGGGTIRLPAHRLTGPGRASATELARYRTFDRVPRSHPAPPAADPAVTVAEAEQVPARTAVVAGALTDLPPRLRAVLVARFGLDGAEARTLRELGEEMHVTRERVRQLEAAALEKLARGDSLARLDAVRPG